MLDFVTNNSNSSWIMFAVLFLGAVAFLAIVRQIETRRLYNKFDSDDIILLSFGVNFFGCESEPGRINKSAGALVLTKNELYYRARYSKQELSIPGQSFAQIDVTDQHKGKPLHQHAIAVYFINEFGNKDKAVFRIPHPAKWVNLMNSMFVKKG